jgi:hypothetical protein
MVHYDVAMALQKVIGRAVMVSLSIAERYQRAFLWLVACAGGW